MLERVWRPVKPWRPAIVLGAVVAVTVVLAFLHRPVPDAVVSLLGGPGGGVDRIGGLRVRYRPPPGVAIDPLARAMGAASAQVDRGVLVLEFPGVTEQLAPELAEALAGGGLTMQVVHAGTHGEELARYAPGTTARSDVWLSESGGNLSTDHYLEAATRDDLERAVAQATAHGWQPAPGCVIAFEQGEIDPPTWRTYEIASEVAIDGAMIRSVAPDEDPSTGRPTVRLNFTQEGEHRFCALTRTIVGHKLAILLGGRVRAAPIINGPICGGIASITLRGEDLRVQLADRAMLVGVLSRRELPRGGRVDEIRWHAPAAIAQTEWIGRLLLGLFAGGSIVLLIGLGLRAARPYQVMYVGRVEGTFPFRRLAVTLLAPLALIVGRMITLPSVGKIELGHLMPIAAELDLSIAMLGIAPILTAFVLVEVVALAVPRLRWRRHDPRGRIALGQMVAALACATALVQAYFLACSIEQLSHGEISVVAAPGWTFRILIMLTLGTATLLLSVVAGVISEHGLGNGYGILSMSAMLVNAVWPLATDPSRIADAVHLDHALEAAVVLATVIATLYCLRWRIADAEDRLALRIPSSGVAPLGDIGVLQFAASLVALGLGFSAGASMGPAAWTVAQLPQPWLMLSLVAALGIAWAWLLSRPSLTASTAQRAGFEPVSSPAWMRATLVSTGLMAGIAALAALARGTDGPGTAANLVPAMLGTAVVLDILDDARARRAALAPAAVFHQIQLADVVERALSEVGIPCHIHASNVRTLLAFVGPWAPVIVLVPRELAEQARNKLDDILRAPMPERRSRNPGDILRATLSRGGESQS